MLASEWGAKTWLIPAGVRNWLQKLLIKCPVDGLACDSEYNLLIFKALYKEERNDGKKTG